jgi:hypothetical protein
MAGSTNYWKLHMAKKPAKPAEHKEGYAPSWGWMRRPELDTARYDAWEAPDGATFGYYHKGYQPWIVNGIPVQREDTK